MTKRAVVLFNLGGPDSPGAVRPFLANLFSDPAILRVPGGVRHVLAWLIARRRAVEAGKIYAVLGGRSPLLENTEAQARALEAALEPGHKVFVAMRYWHPMSAETARAVAAWGPDEVVLLPLYPQFSTTTTASSLRVWTQAARAAGLAAPTRVVCCYPDEPGFIEAQAGLIRPHLDEAARHGRPRVLFSAHGLPKRVVEQGDPYQWQCERTSAALVAALGVPGLDWVSCYQSRVGPLEWIGPSTEEEVRRAGRDGVPLVIVPMAFVSEHSETLVEIEHEYRDLAREVGVLWFARVPTVGDSEAFIQGLARLVANACPPERGPCARDGGRICPARFGGCPARAA